MTCKIFNSLILILILCLATTVKADEIDYDSFDGTVINFDDLQASPSLGDGELVTRQYDDLGVNFSVPNWGAFATNGPVATNGNLNSDPNVVWVNQGGGSASNGLGANIDFDSPVSHVGLLFIGSESGNFTLEVYSEDLLLDSVTRTFENTGGFQEGFTALQADNITRAVVYATNNGGVNWNFSIDDLKFQAIPEPSTTCFFCGLLFVGLSRRRRNNTA